MDDILNYKVTQNSLGTITGSCTSMRVFCVTLYNNECIYQLSFLSSAALFCCLCLFLFSRFLAFLFALISSIVSFLFSSFFTLSLVLVSSPFSLSEEVN